MNLNGMFRLLLCAVLAATSSLAVADDYPTRPIRLIVPYPPGGGTDIVARVIARQVAVDIGQPVLIENRPGAGTTVGSDIVAKSAPDGYTLVFGSVTHTIAPALYRQLPFDAERDFTPIVQIATFPFVLVVNPAVEAKSVAELIALARTRPGALNFASVGNGTGTHLAGEMFKMMSETDIVHVPYKGSGQALPDLLSGVVSMMFMDTPPALPHIRDGTLRALAVTTSGRSRSLPDVPTVAEAGLPGFEFTSWWGVLGPRGMSKAVVSRLNAAFAAALRSSEVRGRLESLAAEPVGASPEQFAVVLKSETRKFAKLVADVGLKLD